MTTYDDSSSLDLRQTAKGIAIRAGVLSLVSLVLGGWLFSLAAKAASGLVKVLVGAVLLAVGGAAVTWEVKKAQRHLRSRNQPALD